MPDSQLAVRPLASQTLAEFIGMEKSMMIDTIRAQCFKPTKDESGAWIEVNDFQVAAFISIAVEMRVNPLLPGMIYAFPVKGGGIVPMIGPDGVYKKLSEHPDVDSWEVEVFPEEVTKPPTHAIAKIYRKGAERPIVYTALLSEWRVEKNPNWSSRPRHMLQLRALKQAARQVIHGLPHSEDDRYIMEEELNVTPGAEPQKRPDPAALKRGRQGASAANPPTPPIDIAPGTDRPVAMKMATAMEPAAETKNAQPPAKAAEPTAGGPTKFVKGEKIVAESKVIKSRFEDFAGSPGAVVEVEGQFTGTLYDLKGGHHPEENMPGEPLPYYFPGKKVRFEATGRVSKALGLIAIVDSASEAPEEADVP